MAGQGTEDQLVMLSRRVHALEEELWQRTVADLYGRFYAAIALGAVILPFVPILEDVVQKEQGLTTTHRYGTLVEMVNGGSGSTFLGFLLVVGLAALLVTASLRVVASYGLPIGIAVTALALLLMLITKPGAGEPVPDLAAGGSAGVALSVVAVVTGVAHALHLYERSRRTVPFQV